MKRVNKMVISAVRRVYRNNIGGYHVGDSFLTVVRGVLRGAGSGHRWKWFCLRKRIERRSIIAGIILQHQANRALYRHVMTGGR